MMPTPVGNQTTCQSAYPVVQCGSMLTAAAVGQEQTLNMTLVTEEGDTVTLAYSEQGQAAMVTYDERGATTGQASHTRAQLADVSFNRELSLTVDGDLNREEQKDVRKALKRIGKMVKAFLQGKMEKVARQAAKLNRLDTVDNIQASYGLTYSATAIVAASQALPYAPVAAPEGNGASTGVARPNSTAIEIEDLTQGMAHMLRESDLDPEDRQEQLSRIFKHIAEDIAPAHWWSRPALALLEMIQERLVSLFEEDEADSHKPSPFEDDAPYWTVV